MRRLIAAPGLCSSRVLATRPGVWRPEIVLHTASKVLNHVTQFIPIRFNEPNTVAYYAELNKGMIVRLSSREIYGTTTRFRPRGVVDMQLYMPISHGEWVKAVWARALPGHDCQMLALIVCI